MGRLICLENVKQFELLDLLRAVLLIRGMIISIFDVLCFKEHSSQVSLQAVRDPGNEK